MHSLATSIERLLDWLTPDHCAACQGELETQGELYCAACASEARLGLRLRWQNGLPAWAIGSYAGPTQRSIKRFKFEGHPELGRRFARVLSSALMAEPTAEEAPESVSLRRALCSACLVPVPLHPERLAERGYNQAALLAKGMARALGCDTRLRALRRVRNSGKQSRLDRAQRLANLQGNIAVRHTPPARVVLVDDVLTTGATLDQCARVLEQAGVSIVGMITIAHTD